MSINSDIQNGLQSLLRLEKRSAAVGIAFFGVLVLSVLLFFLFGNSRVGRVFFFPADASGRIAAEKRLVPNYGDAERDIRELVEGEILGPVDHDLKLMISREVTLRSLFVRNRILYLDLSANFAVLGDDLPLKGGKALEALRKAILFNFRGIREIVFLVDGQAPFYGQTEKIR